MEGETCLAEVFTLIQIPRDIHSPSVAPVQILNEIFKATPSL